MKRIIVLVASTLAAGCSTIDTGYIDYRRAEAVPNVSESISNYIDDQCLPVTLGASTTGPKPSEQTTANLKKCPPLLGARLFRKNLSRQQGIQPNSVFSIRLDHAYLDYVSEFAFRPDRLLDGHNALRAQAEIVVLARAFEFSPVASDGPGSEEETGGNSSPPAPDSEAGFVDMNFESLNSARVIYYSPDVENGQGLNFSNIPILGPAKYNGRPVGIQIIVLELDMVSDEMKGLLSNLASLGQTAGALPTGGITNILTSLGQSLLEGNQDDIIFEYRFALDHSSGANQYSLAPFEAGRYVIRRMQDRDNEHVWRNLQLDHNTGQLFYKPIEAAANSGWKPYSDETYFTLNIIDHGTNAREAVYVNQKLSQLREQLTNSSRADGTAVIEALNTQIENTTLDLRGAVLVQGLTEQWNAVAANARLVAFNTLPASLSDEDKAKCELEKVPPNVLNLAKYDLALSLADFRRGWDEAIADQASDIANFDENEQLRVARNVGSFFASVGSEQPPLPAGNFLSVEQFKQLFGAAAPNLESGIQGSVDALAPKTCDDLIGLGLARPKTS